MSRWSKGAGARLISAVRELSASTPVHELSASAVCQRADLTRDTFYRYASRPIDVLAQAMALDLPSAESLLAMAQQAGRDNPLENPGRAVLLHVENNRDIYRLALHPHLDSELREVLVTRIDQLLTTVLLANPGSAPEIEGTGPTEAEIRRLAIFTAAGIVGAIEDWLAQDDPEGVERMFALLFSAAAPWWSTLPPGAAAAFGRTAEDASGAEC